MHSNAFARARQFLNYYPLAKWSAIVGSLLTAVAFFVLLLLLGLFADLIVNRGEIPSYIQLSASERAAFQAEAYPPDSPEAVEDATSVLRDIGFAPSDARGWLAGTFLDKLSYRENAVVWQITTAQHLRDTVGEDASARYVERLRRNIDASGIEEALSRPVGDLGLLSLVARSRSAWTGGLIASVVRSSAWHGLYANFDTLVGLFLIALTVAVTRFGLSFLARYTGALAVLEAMTRLRRAVYHHTHRLGALALHDRAQSEAIRASSRHLEVVHEGLYRWLTVSFREPAKACLLLLFALLVNVWLAVAFALFAVLLWFLAIKAAAYVRRKGRAALAHAHEQLTLIHESLTITRLVKAFLMEAFNQARVENQLRAYADARLARYRTEACARPLFALVGLGTALLLLFASGYVVLYGQLSVAGAAVLVTALVCLYWPVRAMLDTRRAVRRSREAARALFAFLDRPAGIGQAIDAEFLPALSKALVLDRVTVQQPGSGRRLLRGVSLRIEAGQRVALVGPDRAEKQTLAYLLPRFLDPTSGRVRIDGKELRWVTLDSLRAQIGLVLQDDLVFCDTVFNNIGGGDPAYNVHRIIEAAKTAHAHQFIQKLPRGYETVLGEAGHPLNPGEMFRIALARAILRDPALYVIEEPTTSLDDDTKALADDTFQRVLPGRTVIFLPQRLSTIRSCDMVYVLHQGRIVASGEHRDLLAQSEFYRHLQYLQFNEFAGPNGVASVAEQAHQ